MAARQRFIHPEIWKDPVFGRLQHIEQVLFVGLFSIADDEGRLNADPPYLKSEIFAYKDYTNKKVKGIRDAVVEKVPSVHLYHAKGIDLICLLKWHDYQKPKYAKASKLAAPFLPFAEALAEAFPKPSPEFADEVSTTSRRVGLDREGMDRAVGSALNTGEDTLVERPSDFTIPKLRRAS